MKRVFFALLASSALSFAAHAQTTTPSSDGPTMGGFGFDTAGMDKSVDPGTDFYAYADGAWAKNTAIPADRSNYGMFTMLDDLSQQRTREIIEAAALQPGNKIGDLFSSFMDETAAEAKGIAPIKPWIAKIKAMKTKADIARTMGDLAHDGNFVGPFFGFAKQDDKHPDQYIVSMVQAGLGLPDRDYYLKNDDSLVKARTAYTAYLAKLLTLAGEPNASARAAAVAKLEGDIATVHWNRIESRDSTKTYNKWQKAEFGTKAPGFDWASYMTALGVGNQQAVLISQPSAYTGSAKIMANAPLPLIKDYLLLQTLNGAAPFLSKAFVDAEFDFNSKTLNGIPENQPRWKRGVALVKGSMGEALGQQYVAKYFPPQAKAEADKLVKNVIAAMDVRLGALEWMAPETKAKAREKLAAFTPKIGFPDKWRDYSSLKIGRSDLMANVIAANRFEFDRNLAKLGKPIDRSEWFMTPMEINAYANPPMNEVVFPAAILQPPFFDPKADPAINYGGIGAVIGHEISHHFDDQGRKYDKTGALTDWWTAEDVKRFEALTSELVKQYDAYEPLKGQHVQGGLTLGENIADLAGLTVAYQAYRLSLGGKEAPVIDGMTGDQRFYLGWAQIWRRNYREANLRQRLLTDPHSPSVQRTWVVRNLDPWYGAFGAKTGAAMYMDPAKRVRIW
jgi:putative endopeptidase